jgi:hypothetical protein
VREIHYMLCIIFPNDENMDYNSSLQGPSLTRNLGGEWVWRVGGIYLYIHVHAHSVKTIGFKRNPTGRRRICEYAHPPPVIGEATAHILKFRKCAASLTCNQEIFNTYSDIYINTSEAKQLSFFRGGEWRIA